MAAEIEPALESLLNGHSTQPIEVEIEFNEMPPPGQLEALGLQSKGNAAWGPLSTAKIAAIALFPQVRAIRRSRHPPRPATAGAAPPRSPDSKIGPRLSVELRDPNRQEFEVTVQFTEPPPAELDLPGMSRYSDVLSGTVSRGQIEDLAKRGDVIMIEAQGKMKLL